MDSMLKMELRALIGKYGYSRFWQDIKELNRERISKDRPKREHFPKSMYQKLFDMQIGTCPYCRKQLDIPATKNEVDHKDPNAGEKFNERFNLQLLHRSCNRTKSSKSIQQQSKESGKTFEQLTRVPVNESDEL